MLQRGSRLQSYSRGHRGTQHPTAGLCPLSALKARPRHTRGRAREGAGGWGASRGLGRHVDRTLPSTRAAQHVKGLWHISFVPNMACLRDETGRNGTPNPNPTVPDRRQASSCCALSCGTLSLRSRLTLLPHAAVREEVEAAIPRQVVSIALHMLRLSRVASLAQGCSHISPGPHPGGCSLVFPMT